MAFMEKRNFSKLYFILALIVMSILYNYHEILFKKPQSVHKWRQSDCASIALNFSQGEMNFFEPETHNLTSDGGTTGKCSPSETPILYYSVALLYKVFGYNDFIYRLINTLIFFIGLFYLFLLFHYLIQDYSWSILLSLLFFTSPVLAYYANNYLSNSAALAFSLVFWYYFIRYAFEYKPKWLFLSILFILLAGAMKITALLSLFAAIGVYVLLFIEKGVTGKKNALLKQPVYHILTLLIPIILTGAWTLYAHFYNQKHDSTYFSTTIFPLWDLSSEQISFVFEKVRSIWFRQYFHPSVFVFFGLCLAFLIFKTRKINKVLLYSILFLTIGAVGYVLLQFFTFAEHDYYTIELFILPMLIVVGTAYLFKTEYPKLFSSVYGKIAFAALLVFNIYHARNAMIVRYSGWFTDYPQYESYHTITPYLRSIGISSCDTVISIPDGGHSTLYLMNQKGWTSHTDRRFMRGKEIRYNQDSAGIAESIRKGAKYLIVNGIEEIIKQPYLTTFATHIVGKYNNILIFKLKTDTINFNIQNRVIKARYFCDAETLTQDKQSFAGNENTMNFGNGQNQTNIAAYSGNYSCQVFNQTPYGMTLRINDTEEDESFEITVKRKSTDKKRGFVVASVSNTSFYLNEYEIVDKTNEWETLKSGFTISKEMSGNELVIYVYNTDHEPVFFDDFEIIRYKSIFDGLSQKSAQ
jgi:hypothetical protein